MKMIPLTKGLFTKVDPIDFEWAKNYTWRAHKSGRNGDIVRHYAVRSVGRQTLRLHRCVLNAKMGEEVDHRNGDTLDNRRENLRFVTRQQNVFNSQKMRRRTSSSHYKGVCRVPHVVTPWRAYIGGSGVGAKTSWKHLGYFSSEVAAARAYDHAAVNLYGNFARLNFP